MNAPGNYERGEREPDTGAYCPTPEEIAAAVAELRKKNDAAKRETAYTKSQAETGIRTYSTHRASGQTIFRRR